MLRLLATPFPSRYLSLPTSFLETHYSIVSHSITVASESLVRALNGETLSGQYQCTLVSRAPIETGETYNVLTDFHNCSTINGGFQFAGLSTIINHNYLYTYRGDNGPCAVVYGPLATPVMDSQPLEADPLTVGGGVYVRIGDVGCNLDDSCVYVPHVDGVCDNPRPSTNRDATIPVYVSDPDGLDNTDLTFSLELDSFADFLFDVDQTTGQLLLQQEIDRDSGIQFIPVDINVTDGIFIDQFTVEVTILDVNDNDPTPTVSVFEGVVSENEPSLTQVLRVTFFDLDAGINRQLTYSLPPTVTDFIINSTTGYIYTTRMFDFEEGQNEFQFNVTATDGGGRTGTGQVLITIADLNDNRPTVVVVPSGIPFVEDSPPIFPATVTVDDRDSDIHVIFFAFVTVENNFDGQNEVLDIDFSLQPSQFKMWSSIGSSGPYRNSSILLFTGGASPELYSTLLSSVTYENQAELITLPAERNISYRVCDTIALATFNELSIDTMRSIHPPDITPDLRTLTDQEAELLIADCTAVENNANSTIVNLQETNDRPELLLTAVQYPSITEDLIPTENRGQYVIETFQGAIFDSDREPVFGDVVIIGVSPDTAQPSFAVTTSDPTCRAKYNAIVANGSYECASRLEEGGPCYCPDRTDHTLTCYDDGNTVYMFCLRDNVAAICQCSPPSGGTSDVQAAAVDFGAGAIDISQLITEQFFLHEFTNIDQLYNYTFGFGELILTRSDASLARYTLIFEVTLELFGAVSDESALLLGCYSLVRWNPIEHQTGLSSFSFRAWDRTNGRASGERGVNATSSTDTSFSLTSGLATIDVTPVNDPPLILLGGPTSANFTVTYREGGDSAFIAAMDAVIVELDLSDTFLFNLTISIAPLGGNCDLPDYEGVSDDRLTFMNNNLIPVTVSRTTEGQGCWVYLVDGTLSPDQWRAYLTMIRFSVADDEPSEHTRQISVVISDLVSTSTPSVTTVEVELVSDLCPRLQVAASGTPLIHTEHSGPLVLAQGLNLTDPDRLAMVAGAGVSIVATITNPCRGCVLSVDTGSTGIVSSLSADNLTLTLSGLATPADYQEVLRTASFEDLSAEPTFDLVMIQFTVEDPAVSPGLCPFAVGQVGVMIEHINDNSPDLYLDFPLAADFAVTFTEGAGRVAMTGAMVEIRDLDGVESSVYTVSIVVANCIPLEDRLLFAAPTPATVNTPYDSTTCSMTLLGNSNALESDLGRLMYENIDIDNPTPSIRSVTFTITDGTLASRSSIVQLTVAAINDPPTVDLDTANSFSSDIMVTMLLGTGSVPLTGDSQLGSIVDPDTVNLVSMTLVLSEINNVGGVVDPRSDVDFESLQSTDGPFINGLGLSFQYLQGMGELQITGAASVGEWINSCINKLH